MTDRKTYTSDELQSVLDLHRKWLYNEEGGSRADLSGADLSGAYLSGAYLSGADLSGAYLRCADLSGADLRCADLRCADLSGADLRCADLRRADLGRADLRRAYLRRADLGGADLRRADLGGADLRCANNAELAQAVTVIVPEGAIIGWKKVAVADKEGMRVGAAIAKLRIPADAERSNASGRKCRAAKAEVLDIEPLCEVPDGAVYRSSHTPSFQYSVGTTVEPAEPFDPNRWNECASGIHFFITREEALAWAL